MAHTRARPGGFWPALACAVALLAGCTTEPGPSSGPSGVATTVPTGTAPPTGTTVPTQPVSDGFPILPGAKPSDFAGVVSCTGTIEPADPVAIVQLTGTAADLGPTVLMDYADPDAPRTVCTFSDFITGGLRFVDARHLVGWPTDSQGLYFVLDVPEVRYHWIQLPTTGGSDDLVAVSPALNELVWVDRQAAGAASDEVHVTTAAGDRVVTHLRNTNAGRCGDENDSDYGAYTRSGNLAYVMNRPAPEDASLVVLDGETVAYSLLVPKNGWPVGGGPAMAVWSPTTETLYFRNGTDSWSWSAEDGAKRFLPGVRWFRPAISADGTYLAYTVLGADRLPDVYLVDLANPGEPLHIGTGHGNLPAFLNNDQLFYEGMQYTPGCEGGDIRTPTIYSLANGSETPSTLDSVIATWPSTGSNH